MPLDVPPHSWKAQLEANLESRGGEPFLACGLLKDSFEQATVQLFNSSKPTQNGRTVEAREALEGNAKAVLETHATLLNVPPKEKWPKEKGTPQNRSLPAVGQPVPAVCLRRVAGTGGSFEETRAEVCIAITMPTGGGGKPLPPGNRATLQLLPGQRGGKEAVMRERFGVPTKAGVSWVLVLARMTVPGEDDQLVVALRPFVPKEDPEELDTMRIAHRQSVQEGLRKKLQPIVQWENGWQDWLTQLERQLQSDRLLPGSDCLVELVMAGLVWVAGPFTKEHAEALVELLTEARAYSAWLTKEQLLLLDAPTARVIQQQHHMAPSPSQPPAFTRSLDEQLQEARAYLAMLEAKKAAQLQRAPDGPSVGAEADQKQAAQRTLEARRPPAVDIESAGSEPPSTLPTPVLGAPPPPRLLSQAQGAQAAQRPLQTQQPPAVDTLSRAVSREGNEDQAAAAAAGMRAPSPRPPLAPPSNKRAPAQSPQPQPTKKLKGTLQPGTLGTSPASAASLTTGTTTPASGAATPAPAATTTTSSTPASSDASLAAAAAAVASPPPPPPPPPPETPTTFDKDWKDMGTQLSLPATLLAGRTLPTLPQQQPQLLTLQPPPLTAMPTSSAPARNEPPPQQQQQLCSTSRDVLFKLVRAATHGVGLLQASSARASKDSAMCGLVLPGGRSVDKTLQERVQFAMRDFRKIRGLGDVTPQVGVVRKGLWFGPVAGGGQKQHSPKHSPLEAWVFGRAESLMDILLPGDKLNLVDQEDGDGIFCYCVEAGVLLRLGARSKGGDPQKPPGGGGDAGLDSVEYSHLAPKSIFGIPVKDLEVDIKVHPPGTPGHAATMEAIARLTDAIGIFVAHNVWLLTMLNMAANRADGGCGVPIQWGKQPVWVRAVLVGLVLASHMVPAGARPIGYDEDWKEVAAQARHRYMPLDRLQKLLPFIGEHLSLTGSSIDPIGSLFSRASSAPAAAAGGSSVADLGAERVCQVADALQAEICKALKIVQ